MAEKIPLLAFTISGPMGHFRKFYSNTSALTYPFPPQTTLMGIIAGLLGKERDTYYEELSGERLWVSVRMVTPVRIRTFTVNYLFTKGNALYDKGQGTQIPMALVLPRPPERIIRYRVYVSSPVPELWKELVDVFTSRFFRWPPYLGITEAIAWIEKDIWIGEVEYRIWEDPIMMGTPVIKHPEVKLCLEKSQGTRILVDQFTLDMSLKPYRSPKRTVDVLYEAEGYPFGVTIPYPVFSLPDESLNGRVFGAFFLLPS